MPLESNLWNEMKEDSSLQSQSNETRQNEAKCLVV